MSSFISPAVSTQAKPLAAAMSKVSPAATFSSPAVNQQSSSTSSQLTPSVKTKVSPVTTFSRPAVDQQSSSSSMRTPDVTSTKKPRGSGKVKKLKDPSAPKKAPTAFMLFSGDERPKVMSECGNLPMTEVAKELGRRWSVVDKEVKADWEEKGKIAKAEYDEAMSNYKPSEEFLRKKADNEPKIKVKKFKDPSAPKRPPTAFMLFCGDERPKVMSEYGHLSMTEVAKELGKRWSVVDKEVKTAWEEKGKIAKTEYDEAMSNYKPSEEFLSKKASHEQKMVQNKTSKGNGQSLKKGSFNLDEEDVEDYFNFLTQNWRSTVASNASISGLQVQTLLWKQWVERKSAMNKSAKKSKKDTPTDEDAEGARNSVKTASLSAGAAFSVFSSQMKQAVEQEMNDLDPLEVKQALWDKWQAMGEEERASFQG